MQSIKCDENFLSNRFDLLNQQVKRLAAHGLAHTAFVARAAL
jgi:hypothetical protein